MFICYRCGEMFADKLMARGEFKDKHNKSLCKYCAELDDENGELK